MQLLKNISIKKQTACSICANENTDQIIALPNLPLTGRFEKSPMTERVDGVDQFFRYCEACGHGQLERQIDPSELYNSEYSFRTSVSQTARAGTAFFLNALEQCAPKSQFDCVLDVGCNDGYLLDQLKGRVKHRIGIDPILQGQDKSEDGLQLIGQTLERTDLKNVCPVTPDLIVCRHTIEHVSNPREFIAKLLDAADDNTLLLFETPSLDVLLERYRFDQVFHQHYQYFSIQSFQALLSELGAEYLSHWINFHDWGAMCVAFQKGSPRQNEPTQVSAQQIKDRYRSFKEHMNYMNRHLQTLKSSVCFGYGAGNMLPVLAYHLNDDLSFLQCVLDDDPLKESLYYWNLPLQVLKNYRPEVLKEANVLITAVDCAAPIMNHLLSIRARNVVYPLMFL